LQFDFVRRSGERRHAHPVAWDRFTTTSLGEFVVVTETSKENLHLGECPLQGQTEDHQQQLAFSSPAMASPISVLCGSRRRCAGGVARTSSPSSTDTVVWFDRQILLAVATAAIEEWLYEGQEKYWDGYRRLHGQWRCRGWQQLQRGLATTAVTPVRQCSGTVTAYGRRDGDNSGADSICSASDSAGRRGSCGPSRSNSR